MVLFVLSATEIAFANDAIRKEASQVNIRKIKSSVELYAYDKYLNGVYFTYINDLDRLRIYPNKIEIIKKTGEKIIIDLKTK